MNYRINYAANANTGQIPVAPADSGKRTIVLSSQSQNCQSGHVNATSNQQFPMVMQVPGLNPPVFYTHQGTDGLVNSGIPNKGNGNAGPVIVSPVSPVQSNINILKQDNMSPNAINLQSDTKHSVSRSLGDMFSGIQSIPGPIMGSSAMQSSVPMNASSSQSNSDIANLLSSLQASGLQIVETNTVNGNNAGTMPMSVVNIPPQQVADGTNGEKTVMNNFVTSLQSAGIHIIENTDRTLSISLPSTASEDTNVAVEKSFSGLDVGGKMKASITSKCENEVGQKNNYSK